MFLERKPLGVYGANCFVVACEQSREALVIDPGGEPEEVEKIISENGLELRAILLTHGHGDHIAGVNGLVEKYGAEVLIHEADAELLDDPQKNLSVMMPISPVTVGGYGKLKDGDSVEFGNLSGEVIHTPGHTRGCICLKVENMLFTGDTLFRGSIGRTDLYGGGDDILDSIEKRIVPLNDETVILPGHGAVTSLEAEKRENPYLIQILKRV